MNIDGKSVGIAIGCIVIGIIIGVLLSLVLVPQTTIIQDNSGDNNQNIDPIIGRWYASTSFVGVASVQSIVSFYDDKTGNVMFDIINPIIGTKSAGFNFSWDYKGDNVYSTDGQLMSLDFTLSESNKMIKTTINPSVLGIDGFEFLSVDLRYTK